jgi:threonyl-tRNA synthetase
MVGVSGSIPLARTIASTVIFAPMPVITLPDGSLKRFDRPISVAEIAASIGPGLARAALAGRVDGALVDTAFIVDADAAVSIVTDKDPDGLEVIRHSTAHLLANAVQELFPDAQVTIGPVIEDGFFYDFAYQRPFTTEDLAVDRKAHGRDCGQGLAGAPAPDAAR